jgi:hypothetical protein
MSGMMVLMGPLSGFAAARGIKAGTGMAVLSALGGLGFGYLMAQVSGRGAYAVLLSEKLKGRLKLSLYMLIPMIALAIVVVLPILAAQFLCGGRT